MNREIKFRGFSIDKKKWVYGNYNYTFERGYLSQGYDDVPPRCYYIDTETNYYEVYSQSIGQFTGLKDKSGKEIYEGDIIQEGKRLWQVGFKDGCFVGVDFKNATWDELINIGYGNIEVIGNIYENPELLEKVE